MRRTYTILASLFLNATAAAPSAAAPSIVDVRLVQAVKGGDRTTAFALLQQRVDVNAGEADGSTALHYAVRADDRDLVERLIRAGANVKVANRYGVTPRY